MSKVRTIALPYRVSPEQLRPFLERLLALESEGGRQMATDLQSLLERRDTRAIYDIALKACESAEWPKHRREEAFVFAARAAAAGGHWNEVADWAERGLALHLDTELTPWLHHLYGVAQAHAGDGHRAIKHLTGFVRMAKRSPGYAALLGDSWEALAHTQRAYRNGKKLGRELAYFRLAARSYEMQQRHRKALDCYAEMAWSYLVHDRPDKARPYLHQLLAVKGQRTTNMQLALALNYTLSAERARATQLCQDILSRLAPTHEQLCDVLWILALLHWHAGETEPAKSFALAARASAFSPWSPLQLERAGNLLGLMGRVDSWAEGVHRQSVH